MTDDHARSALDAVLAARLDDADRREVTALMHTERLLRSRLDAFRIHATRRIRELADTGAAEPVDDFLGAELGFSSNDAASADDRERVCAETADVEDALAQGHISQAHLDVLAHTARSLDDDLRRLFLAMEEELLAAAAREHVDVFAKRCRRIVRELQAAQVRDGDDELAAQRKRSRVKRWIDKATGMHHTHIELDPQRDAAMWTAIRAHLNALREQETDVRRSYHELEVEALVAAVTSGSARSPLERVPEVSVLIDYDTLCDAAHTAGVCETDDGVDLPAETVRRMCCDAGVLPIVLDGVGRVLDEGRAKRTVTPEQRRALRAMHSTCAHPACSIPFSACKAHHINHWTRDRGPTDLDNLVPLCERHHHLVHEGGWNLSMTPDRVVTWFRPDGTAWRSHSSIDRTQRRAA